MNPLPTLSCPAHARMPAQTRRPARGLSLTELLCSVAIMAVLVGGAMPLFNELRWSQALQAHAAMSHDAMMKKS